METHLIIFLYLLLFSFIVEKICFKKIIFDHQVASAGILKELVTIERNRRRAYTHLFHGYLLGLILVLKIIFFTIELDNLPFYFYAIFFSVSLSFIYLFDRVFLTIICLLAIISLSYLCLSYIAETISLHSSPSFYSLLTLFILVLYISLKRR